MCRLHGVGSTVDAGLWAAAGAPPPYYPGVITLAPGVSAAAVDEVARPDAAVKDSYADLPLGTGYQELFSAEWISHPGPPADPGSWQVVRSEGELALWRRRHGAADALVPELLTEPDVAVLARYDGDRLVAGAVAHRSAEVTGISNVFGVDPWPGLAAAAAARFGERPLVGYERGAELAAARQAGFTTAGPLRVWLRRRPD